MFYYKQGKTLFNSFSDLSDFYNFIQKTPRRRGAEDSSETGDPHWTGTENYEEAIDLFLCGDEKLYEEFKQGERLDVSKILGNNINRKKYKNDLVGFQPNVPNYLMNIPNDMINEEPKKISQKILNIAVSMSVSAGVSPANIKKAGMLYIKILDLLEKAGYRVNLYIMTNTYAGGSNNYNFHCMIRIKTDREPLNIKKCVFPIAHPSMLRRLFFKWDESCDADYELTDDGYGRPNTNTEEVKTTIDKILKSNFIIWKFQSIDKIEVATEKILKELDEKYGIKIGG